MLLNLRWNVSAYSINMYRSLPATGLPIAGKGLDLASLINLSIYRPYKTASASARSLYITTAS